MSKGSAALRVEQLVKVYGSTGAAGSVRALDGVTASFEPGMLHAITGPSGSGKSTLLQCCAGLDRPTSGRVLIDDVDVLRLSAKDASRLRLEKVGFIFQRFNLIPTLSARENITLPMDLAGLRYKKAWVDALVDALSLGQRIEHAPGQLSGGQQQRVAIARALVARPQVVFADEPTGSLDSTNAMAVLDTLEALSETLGQTIILVTHDEQIARRAHRELHLVDGRVRDDSAQQEAGMRSTA